MPTTGTSHISLADEDILSLEQLETRGYIPVEEALEKITDEGFSESEAYHLIKESVPDNRKVIRDFSGRKVVFIPGDLLEEIITSAYIVRQENEDKQTAIIGDQTPTLEFPEEPEEMDLSKCKPDDLFRMGYLKQSDLSRQLAAEYGYSASTVGDKIRYKIPMAMKACPGGLVTSPVFVSPEGQALLREILGGAQDDYRLRPRNKDKSKPKTGTEDILGEGQGDLSDLLPKDLENMGYVKRTDLIDQIMVSHGFTKYTAYPFIRHNVPKEMIVRCKRLRSANICKDFISPEGQKLLEIALQEREPVPPRSSDSKEPKETLSQQMSINELLNLLPSLLGMPQAEIVEVRMTAGEEETFFSRKLKKES